MRVEAPDCDSLNVILSSSSYSAPSFAEYVPLACLDSELSERRTGALTLESLLLINFSILRGRGLGCIPLCMTLRFGDRTQGCEPARRGSPAGVVASKRSDGCNTPLVADDSTISLGGSGSGPFLRLRPRTTVTFLLFLQREPWCRVALCAEVM